METCFSHPFSRRIILLLSAVLCVAALAADAPKMYGSIPEVHIVGNYGMVPLQPTVDYIDAKWALDPETKSITVTFPNDRTLVCTVDKKEAQVNGKAMKLMVAPFEHGGIIYIPSELLPKTCEGTATIDPQNQRVNMNFVGPQGQYSIYLPFNMMRFFPNKEKFDDSDTELYIVAMDGTGQRRLSYNTGPDTLPVFPPNATADNLRMIYQRNGAMFIRDVTSRSETPIAKNETPTPEGPGVPPGPPPPPPGGGGPGMAMPFTPGGEYYPECVSPDGTTLYFTQRYGGADMMGGMNNICSAPLIGTDTPKLLLNMASSPSLSPDGKFLLFSSRMMAMGPEQQPAIQVIDPANPGQPRNVGEGENPSFSPSGRSIIFTKQYASEDGKKYKLLVTYVSQGGKPPLIYEPKPIERNHDEVFGGFTPDSKKVFYSCDTGISSMKPDRTEIKQITTNSKDRDPQLTKDASQIVFLRGDDLFIMSAEGTDVKQLTRDIKVLSFRIAPGGKQVFFTARPEEPAPPATPKPPVK